MQRTFLIDGYNLLHAMGILAGRVGPHGLEKARHTLLDMLADAFGAEVACLKVVFDAARAPAGVKRDQHYRGIHVLFAPARQEADDLIEDLIACESQPRHLVVVSSDHRLQQAAHRRGAHEMDCHRFLDLLEERRQPASSPSQPAPEKCDQPTEEEARRWLEEFKDLQEYLDRQDPY